jgi:hypothetical protein
VPNVDLRKLDGVEAGDAFRIHFKKSAIGALRTLLEAVRIGRIKVVNEETLRNIIYTDDWGDERNQYVTVIPTEIFGGPFFKWGVVPFIDHLKLLVDRRVVELPEAELYFRFKAHGLEGVKPLLWLDERQAVTLEDADVLQGFLDHGAVDPSVRYGRVISHLGQASFRSNRRYFLNEVLPHLELLQARYQPTI